MGRCQFCVMPANTVDHRLPLAWGGEPYDWANLQSMCEKCHGMKTNEERTLGIKMARLDAGEPEIDAHVLRWTPA